MTSLSSLKGIFFGENEDNWMIAEGHTFRRGGHIMYDIILFERDRLGATIGCFVWQQA